MKGGQKVNSLLSQQVFHMTLEEGGYLIIEVEWFQREGGLRRTKGTARGWATRSLKPPELLGQSSACSAWPPLSTSSPRGHCQRCCAHPAFTQMSGQTETRPGAAMGLRVDCIHPRKWAGIPRWGWESKHSWAKGKGDTSKFQGQGRKGTPVKRASYARWFSRQYLCR